MAVKDTSASSKKIINYQAAKDLIDRNPAEPGGSFYSETCFHENNHYATAIFLSRKNFDAYNLFIQTARFSYISSVWERAMHLACGHDPNMETPSSFAGYDPKTGWLVMEPPSLPVPAHLSDKDALRYELAIIRQVADSGVVSVKQGWDVYRERIQGSRGVHAIVDVHAITTGVISEFIGRFLTTESSWSDPEPKSFRFADIENWYIACEGEDAWVA